MTPRRGVLSASGRFRGVLCMLLATLCFAAMHGTIRHLAPDIHPFEMVFLRNLFGFVVLAPWFFRYGAAPLRTARLGLHGLRALLHLLSMLCFFSAVGMATLTDVTALSFTAPIFAPVLAVLLIGERVGMRSWLAILLGFAGALIVLRPGLEAVGPGETLALSSSVFWACALVAIKVLGRTESALTITTYMVILMTPFSLLPALFVWTWPTWPQLAWLAAMGALGTVGHLALNQALKDAETHVVMPIDFARLVWVSIIGVVAFAEPPDVFTWLGGAVIGASAGYIAVREGRRRAAGRRR